MSDYPLTCLLTIYDSGLDQPIIDKSKPNNLYIHHFMHNSNSRSL